MKKIYLVILCISLSACGYFDYTHGGRRFNVLSNTISGSNFACREYDNVEKVATDCVVIGSGNTEYVNRVYVGDEMVVEENQ